MIDFVSHQADYILFLHGLALIVLHAECVLLGRVKRGPELPWLWLSLSSALLGTSQWLHLLFPPSSISSEVWFTLPLRVGSLLCLVEFGRRGLRGYGVATPGRWIHSVIAFVATGATASGSAYLCMAVRAVLLPMAGTGAAVLFWTSARRSDRPHRTTLRVTGLAVLLEVIACCIVPPGKCGCLSHLGPAVVSDSWWVPLTYLVRVVIATTAAVCLGCHYERIRRLGSEPERRMLRRSVQPLTAVALVLVLVVGWILTHTAGNVADADERRSLLARATVAATAIDASVVSRLHGEAADESGWPFAKLRQILRSIKNASGDCRYVYLMGQRGDSIIFLVDGEPAGSEGYSPPGSVYKQASSRLKASFSSGLPFVDGPITDAWGCWVSAIAPIRSAQPGRVVAVLGMDVSADRWAARIAESRRKSILATLLMCALLIGSAIALSIDEESRRRSELAIRERERKFRELFHSLMDAVYLCDLNDDGTPGRIIEANQVACTRLGYTRDELLGMSGRDLCSPEDWNRVVEAVAGLSEEGEVTFEVSSVTKDGRGISMEVSVHLLTMDGRKVMLGVSRDITARKQAQDALAQSEERFRGLFATMSEGCAIHEIVYGPDGTPEDYIYVEVNAAAERIIGFDREHVLGRRATEVLGVAEAPCLSVYADVVATGEPHTFEVFFEPLGKHFRVSAFSPGHRTFATVFEDITERKRAEEAMRTQISAMNAASDQIVIANPQGEIVFANSAFAAETGCPAEQAIGLHVSTWLGSDQSDNGRFAEIWSTVTSGGTWQGEIASQAGDGASRIEDVIVTPATNEAGATESVIAIKRNITEKRIYEERLDHLAHHDPLTGLPNRLLFSDRLSQSLARAKRRAQICAVMFLDLDGFKLINDTMGHNAGDVLLWQVAGRLTKRLRDVDTIARMGGDEFTIILTDIESADDAVAVAQRVLSLFTEPFKLMGRDLFVSTSVGISMFPSDGDDAETLVRNADTAMYRAKEQGKNSYCVFMESMNAAALEQMTLLNNLRMAIQNDEFLLHYQPRVDIRTGELLGVEALLRWIHPELGFVPPSQFIPVAEDSGLIGPITEWVLAEACRQNKAWQEAGLPWIEVAVNVSARQMEQRGLVSMIERTLKQADLSPEFLGIELTESALMRNPELSVEILRQIREMGVKVSIDDFGTGHSSLSKLKHLPLDTVKIDQSFVKDINTNEEDAAIATAIVAMAHGMRLRVLAEGVETLEQLELLRSLECDEVQGYFIGRPVPPAELEETLRQSMRQKPFERRAA